MTPSSTPPSWNPKNLLEWTQTYLEQKGVDSPRLDAELLLSDVLGLERIQLYTQWDRPLKDSELAAYKALVQRRGKREPLAYILGEKEFFSLKFKVGPGVLVPRPETEELVEKALDFLKSRKSAPPRILDLGTGSGCILISLLANYPEAQAWGMDQSETALGLAEKNAQFHQVAGRAHWVHGDFLKDWPTEIQGPWDLVLANLPYIPEGDYSNLQTEVRDFEPKEALIPGPSGLEAFHAVIPLVFRHLKEGGQALFEMGLDQGPPLQEWCQALRRDIRVKILPDLSGRQRFLTLDHGPK